MQTIKIFYIQLPTVEYINGIPTLEYVQSTNTKYALKFLIIKSPVSWD